MSLVLEALKKLEREKGRDERGFLVMAAAPWPVPAARRWPLWVAAGVAAGAAAVLALRWSTEVAAPPPVARVAGAGPAGQSALPAPPGAADRAAGPAMTKETPGAGAIAATRPIERTVPPTGARKAASRPASMAAEPAGDRAPVPAAPTAAARDPAHGLRLQAISERDGQPIAIISDRLVRVGDEWEGVRVLAIRDAEVDVEVRGRRTTLRF